MELCSDIVKKREVLQNLNDLIRCGDLNKVREFVERENPSPDIFEKLREISWSRKGVMPHDHPVCLATKLVETDILNFLLLAGFNPEGVDVGGTWLPIHFAAEIGELDVLKLLVEKWKVNVDVMNKDGDTPLSRAAGNGYLEIVKFLVESEASVNYCQSAFFTTALHKGAHKPEVCEYLISVGANVNAKTEHGITPLHYAVCDGNAKSAEILLDNGAGVNSLNEWGVTPFSMGISIGNLDVLKLLYSRGGDPEFQDNKDNTPLHRSVVHVFYDICRYLAVDVGVKLNKKNVDGETPFSIAMKNGRKSFAQLLISAGYDPGTEEFIYDDLGIDKIYHDDDGKEFVKDVRQAAINPRCLQDICCFMIRRVLGRDVPSLVDSLPLPQKLKNSLMLCHV